MTLLKRKSALWYGRPILLVDWVSGPLKNGAAQVPRKKEHTSHQALTLSHFLEEKGGWVGWWGCGDPACPNCRHSAAASITRAVGLFLQSHRVGAKAAVSAENLS